MIGEKAASVAWKTPAIKPRTWVNTASVINTPTNLGEIVATNISTVAHASGRYYGRILFPSATTIGTGIVRVGDRLRIVSNGSGNNLRYDNPSALIVATDSVAGTADYEISGNTVGTISSQQIYCNLNFYTVILAGVKSGKTPNTGNVFVQLVSEDFMSNPSTLYPIKVTPGSTVTIEIPEGGIGKLTNIWMNVDTANDGLVATFFTTL